MNSCLLDKILKENRHMKLDTNYNYFYDVNPDFSSSTHSDRDTISPDSCSARLYDALFRAFFYDADENEKYGIPFVQIRGQKFKRGDLFYSFFISTDKRDISCENPVFLLSADYIGPSAYWCSSETIKAEDIIKEARTLGGHMVWPRDVSRKDSEKRWITLRYKFNSDKKSKYYNEKLSIDEIERFKKEKEQEDNLTDGRWIQYKITINTAKGGEYGLFDRIDCLLKLLELYYELLNHSKDDTVPSEKEFLGKCKEKLYNKTEINWKEEIKSFCTFFKLNNSFVDENYNVIFFEGGLFPIQRPGDVYVKNNLNAIKLRNEYLQKVL